MGMPPLVEPVALQDVFVSGIARIEAIGPVARFILYVDAAASDGEPERRATLKIVIPIEALPTCIKQVVHFVGAQIIAQAAKAMTDDAPSAPLVH